METAQAHLQASQSYVGKPTYCPAFAISSASAYSPIRQLQLADMVPEFAVNDEGSPFFVAVLVALLLVFVLTVPSAQERAVAHLPKPSSTLPFLGNTIDFAFTHRKRLHTWIAEECAKHGGEPWVVRVLGRSPMVFVYTEQGVEDVLKTQFDIFEKGELAASALEDVFGNGLAISHGNMWRQQRKLASSLFTASMMRKMMNDVVVEAGGQVCDIIGKAADAGEMVELKHLMDLFANDVLTKVGFGVDLKYLAQESPEFFTRLNRVSGVLLGRALGPGWLWKLRRLLNIGSEKQQKQDIAWINTFVYGIIADSVAGKQAAASSSSMGDSVRRDLISLFLTYDNNGSVADEQTQMKSLRDMVVVFLQTGRSTTSHSIDWLVIMLARYPHVQDKIRAELSAKIPDLMNGTIKVPSKDQIGELTYMDAAIHECIRLNSTAPLTTRVPTRDTTLSDGTFIKKGTSVMTPHYAMGRMKFIWGDSAEEFKPERWIDGATGKFVPASPFKFFSFSAGPRICIGKNFALMEIKMLAAALFAKFEIMTERDPFEYEYHSTLTLGIEGPLIVRPTRVPAKAF
ncbi:Cytochrome p450, partial [Globisporangium splendens]